MRPVAFGVVITRTPQSRCHTKQSRSSSPAAAARLPCGRPTLVCGAAGCGKTLLAAEFLVRGAVEFDEPGVLMAFEETEKELTANVASLGFDLAGLVRQKKIVVDFVHIERGNMQEAGDYDLEGIFLRLGHAIDSIGAKRVVLDTLEVLFSSLPNEAILRAELRRLFRWLKDKGVTAVITAERGREALTRHGLEEYVSDCVLLLDHRVHDQIATRHLRVVKYRGAQHGTNEFPFLIGAEGISVLPITSLGLNHEVSSERIATGIPRLDAMLGGRGFYRGSSILLTGTPGTGKTSVAANFARAAGRRQERTLFFSFEESPAQIVRNMKSITQPRPAPETPVSLFRDDPINILIVDDEPKNLTVLETVLDDPAYRLVRAESADQALLALVVEEFALLILDIRMPGMTGFELAQMIKERKKTARVPIIFLTAYYNEDQHVLEGYDSGAVDYLHKPVNAAILRSKVAVFAELHRKSRECALANRALLVEVTERRRAEEQLRALTQRMVRLQEVERGSVALDLHDNITQLLCAILARSQALVTRLTGCDGSPKQDAIKLREMLGTAAEAVARISHSLRPSVLEHLGLAAVLRATGTEFAERTGVAVIVACGKPEERLPIATEMALFRILQDALINVERHARAHRVTVDLTQQGGLVQLTIEDDGIGFDPAHHEARTGKADALGLLGMRERATSVGGTFTVKSGAGVGTKIAVRISPPAVVAPA